MGRAKQVVFYKDRYKGTLMEESTCDKLESLIKLSKSNGCVKDLRNIIFDLSPSEVDLIQETRSNDFIDLSEKHGKLEDPQTLGVAFSYFAKRMILGDSVGLGKTVEICGLFNLIESTMEKDGLDFRFLFLTGKTLINQAVKEISKFTGNYVEPLFGEKDKVQKFIKSTNGGLPPSIVGAHSLLKSVYFQEYINSYIETNGYMPFDILVIDESGDILTNSKTQYYKDGKILADMFDRVILLNATSFEKDLRQFYCQLSFIDDTLLPTKTAFSNEFEVLEFNGRPYKELVGKYKNQDKFRDLVSYRYFARTRKSVGAKFENCTADIIVSDLSKEQKKLLNMVSMPMMVYDCPSYFDVAGYDTNVDTTPKLKDLLSLIGGKLRNEKSILVYARYKEAQKCIYNELCGFDIDCAYMNGDTEQKYRDELIDKFKLGDLQVLITNVQKGLNFGSCNHCIFYDYDPSPNKMVQFEGRMTRTYDIVDKHSYILVSRGKELDTLKASVAQRAQASDIFAGSDYSCVLSLLLDKNKLKEIS